MGIAGVVAFVYAVLAPADAAGFWAGFGIGIVTANVLAPWWIR